MDLVILSSYLITKALIEVFPYNTNIVEDDDDDDSATIIFILVLNKHHKASLIKWSSKTSSSLLQSEGVRAQGRSWIQHE